MTQPLLPRYFIGRSNTLPDGGSSGEILPPDHVIDSFFIGNRHLVERELAIAVDGLGNLQAILLDEADKLPAAVKTELAYHEMSGSSQRRRIEAAEFFLFRLELLEQPARVPGWNDPVYLYGTLYGPWPASVQSHPVGIEGQLTITRGDLLEGLVRGACHAFRYSGSDADGTLPVRCFHLLLPGDRDEEIRCGSGIVLAYPLFPPELILTGISNEIVVSQLLYDILSTLKEDLECERVAHPLRSMVLPVPNRMNLEQQLTSKGYEIKGDTAVKKVDAGAGFQGFLAAVFGSLMSERLDLPPEGEVDDFLNLATITLNALPDWPTSRILALRNCVKQVTAEAHRAAATRRTLSTQQIKTPQPGKAQQPAQLRQIRQVSKPQDWMQDFIAAHHQPGAPPPRLTSTAVLKRESRSTSTDKSEVRNTGWMKDFAPQAQQAADKHEKPDKSEIETEPEWIDDFK